VEWPWEYEQPRFPDKGGGAEQTRDERMREQRRKWEREWHKQEEKLARTAARLAAERKVGACVRARERACRGATCRRSRAIRAVFDYVL
jgi:hypothetical protein